jgi:hypothetical protein
MARTFNGTSQSIECAAPVAAVPLTIACWFYPTSSAAAVVCSIGQSGATDRFQLSSNPGGSALNATTVQSGVAQTAALSSSIPLNTWHHGAAVFSAINSRQSFLNGTGSTLNTGSSTPSGINRLNISGAYAPSLTAFFTGQLAEVCVWNAALAAAEITELAAGFNPRIIRPQNIVYFNRLINESIDIRGGLALTNVGGATTVATHPRIIYP